MSKRLLFIRPDKSVAVSSLDSKALSALTGSGGMVKAEHVEWEIAKHFITSDADSEACKADHVAFLAPHIGSAREVAVRAWVMGITNGGLTEAEALAVFDGFIRPSDCTSCKTIEDTDVPTDRTFRDAWEWED